MRTLVGRCRVSFGSLVLLVLSAACKPSGTNGASEGAQRSAAEGGNIDIQGAGATFPYPLYSKWIAEYQKIDPRVRINYQSIGSGGGIRQILERTVDFGASDAPMTDQELAKAPAPIVHIPATLGAVVVAYNVPSGTQLTLSPDLLSKIFLGEIVSWDDPAIAALNGGANLEKAPITVVYRSDGSGTTAVFTDYLSKVSPTWREKVGAGKSVRFPAGLGAKGNEGVTGQLKTTPGTIGYVELAYAVQTKLSHAAIQNRAGKAVSASVEGITAAASAMAGSLPDDLRVSIVDAPGDNAYPIASFTYLLLYEEQQNATKGTAIAQFLWWAVHAGQNLGPALHYAQLPEQVVARVEAKIRALKSGGRPLLALAP